MHAAGLAEPADTYVCTDMTAATLENSLDRHFTRWSPAFRNYAIAGVLHLDHLADMASDEARPAVRRHASLLGPALRLSPETAEQQLSDLLKRHAAEWKTFMNSLGENSFVRQWARCDR